MNWITRLDVIVLTLMLAYVVVVTIHVSCRYHLARRKRQTDAAGPAFQRTHRKLNANLSIKVDNVKSIASTAPYLGLAGTCFGILNAFRGIGMEKHTAMAMMTTYIAASLITTATGLLVAIPAVWSYNYLRVHIDRLECEIPSTPQRKSRCFQVAQKLPLTARFSKIPFAVIAAPVLALTIAGFMTFSSFYTPKGLPVRLVKISVPNMEHFSVKPIVIEIVGTSGNGPPAVYVNLTKTAPDELENKLRSELKVRPRRLAHVQAGSNVSWGDVVNVIDVAEGLRAEVVLSTITPNINAAGQLDYMY